MYLDISYLIIEVIFTNSMWKLLAVLGVGAATGACVFYKMKNPNCIKDLMSSFDNMKKSVPNDTNKAS